MYLVSACLAGINCRYDGGNTENEVIAEMVRKGEAIPVCPEQLAGLPTPRICCEIVSNTKEQQAASIALNNESRKVMNKDGLDLTKEFEDGAEKTLAIAKSSNITKAILKSKSPSCGCGIIYDGTFSGKLIPGNGVTAELLLKNGIEVYTENEIEKL
jgi:uncharacterized protein YbbK (DUF523 family)